MQQALIVTLPVITALGSICFFYASAYYKNDLFNAQGFTKNVDNQLSSVEVSDDDLHGDGQNNKQNNKNNRGVSDVTHSGLNMIANSAD